MLKQRHQLFVLLFVCLDGLMASAACVASWAVRRALIERSWPGVTPDEGLWTHIREPLLLYAVPITLMVMWAFGLYRPRRDRGLLAEQLQVLRASGVTIVMLIVALWLLGTRELGGWTDATTIQLWGLTLDAARLQIGALAIVLPIVVGGERIAFRLALRHLRARGWNQRHVCIIGTGRLGRIVCRTLDRNTWTGIHVASFISHNDVYSGSGECCGRPVMGGLADIERLFQNAPPDAVYIAVPTARTLVRPQLLRRLERFPVEVRIVPDVLPRYLPDRMVMSELDGMPIMSVRESPLHGVGGVFKRCLDIVGALVGLLVFAIPMAVIALVIRATSPGPVIFRQRRVSLGGEEFLILKFRTMVDAAAEATVGWTTRHDPRITPVGRWLRRSSLDELPQLFNVLMGDMSLVGPRPERPELTARFRDDWRGYMLRQHVKAGITGWAQVNGLRGDTSLRKRLQLDLFYVRNWSVGFDLKILALTLVRGFVHPNAH